MKTDQLKKILILRPRFLGDMILATGIVDILRRENPGSEIWFMAERGYSEVLQNHPGLTGVLSFDPLKKNNPFYLWDFFRKLRQLKFDAVLDLFCNPRTAQMAYWSGAPVRVGFEMRGRSWAYNHLAPPSSPPFPSGRRRVTEAYLDQLRVLGIQPASPYKTSLGVADEEKAHVRKLLERAQLKPGEKIVALSPGASWPAKRWPLERFIELGFWLKREGVRPLYLFGPKEADLVAEFEGRMDKDWLLINQPNIRGLMAFIEAADALIANDSGPMHVGPAVGTPTLGIFGPGEPEIWFPYDRPHQYAYAEVGCSHCGLDYCNLMACMDRLGTKEMFGKVMTLIGKKAAAV